MRKGACMVRRNRKNGEPDVLVNGYYMPKEIVDGYLALRDQLILELTTHLEKDFCNVTVELTDRSAQIVARNKAKEIGYCLHLSPRSVSQLEKVMGTQKFSQVMHELQEE